MKITKEQLVQIIREELDERIKFRLPRLPKFTFGKSKEETPEEAPEETPEVAPEEETDTEPAETWKTRWSEPEPAWGLTAKERRDQRSQEIGQRKEAERAARKAKRRAEMGITKEELAQIVKEEIVSLAEIGQRGRDSQLAKDIAAHRARQGTTPTPSPYRDEDLRRAKGQASTATLMAALEGLLKSWPACEEDSAGAACQYHKDLEEVVVEYGGTGCGPGAHDETKGGFSGATTSEPAALEES